MVDTLNPRQGRVRDLLRLSLTPDWGPRRIRDGLEEHGSVEALLRTAARTDRDVVPLSRVDEVLAECRRTRVTPVALDGSAYPAALLHLSDPPPVIYHRGDLSVLSVPGVVIVGSRRATAYGRRTAAELAARAARAGRVVVSGMALGVDGAAHRGALEAGGVTAAILGSGPDRPSPRAHRALAGELLRQGAVLSEHPPGTPPLAHHFPRRNRLLAALGDRVVVVEAAVRSGALITARLALELGREVWAVPGSVFSPVSAGAHRLLEDGARPVTDLDAWSTSFGSRGLAGDRSRPPVPDLDDPATTRVWSLLEDDGLALDEILARAGLPADRLLTTLSRLELEGWIRRLPGPGFSRRVA